MSYFVTEYTIHFDDTMAYGSHHFLTSFKFQCAARESFLFGDRIFDMPGVKEALDRVHLFTADAYTRNLSPARLGDRVAILLTLEEWGRASARFCYRVIGQQGQSICAGFQTLICADAMTQSPIELPSALRSAMEAFREIEEVPAEASFRARVLAGGQQLESLFGPPECQAARQFLAERYPAPRILARDRDVAVARDTSSMASTVEAAAIDGASNEAWLFAGQAAFDAHLLAQRVAAYREHMPRASQVFADCEATVKELIGGDSQALFSGCEDQIQSAVRATPALAQVAIHLQNVLGAELWRAAGHLPSVLVGHSFGEIAALGVAGCFDLCTGVRIVGLRMRAIGAHGPESGGLMVVSADRTTASIEAHLLALDQVVVAGRNHSMQTVVSGPIEQLNALQNHLQKRAISASFIPSPTCFHHPALKTAALQWLSELRQLEFRAPALSVYSPIGRRFITDADDIATVLAAQLLRPFDLEGAIRDVLGFGVACLVDCGSAGMLARLVSKTATEPSQVINVASDLLSTRPAEVAQTTDDQQPSSRHASHTQHSAALQTSELPRIVLVGQGCILPGGASSPDKLFSSIMEQRVGIVDQRRFDEHWEADFYTEKLTADRSYSHLTGRVEDADIQVPLGVDAQVFQNLTRTQKLLCIALAPCVASLKGANRILCLVGATADGFEDQDHVSSLRYAGLDPCEDEIRERLQLSNAAFHDPHGAVQEVFDLLVRPGLEVILIDAACASSLYTVALGMHALETHQADAVVAGGLFCPGPGNSCLFSQFRGTTSTGCRPFDAKADGVVFSEGAALVTLRRESDALQMRLPIEASILGAGLSSDGKSSSANVPQTKGQLLSLARCYENYRIDPALIDAVEGHGTSTPVGDSTEVETLRQFFAEHLPSAIPLHSLKGLLGHAGWAAGTASLIAACQYLRQGIFPAQAMYREPSAAVKQANGTLSVSDRASTLPSGRCQIAIDGFGFGGANAHVVVSRYEPSDTVVHAAAPIVGSSDRDRDRDRELVLVACQQESIAGPDSRAFDRSAVQLPKKYLVLPELADDMDISQKLAVVLADSLLAQLPHVSEDLKRETSLVLALRGKSERGIEATMRIMTPRYRRVFAGIDRYLERLQSAYQEARPSGAYTLQCMMPNVASGRAALLLNLNGPNFVVDAGDHSLEAAFRAARLLLSGGDHNGTTLAIVAAISANSNAASSDNYDDRADEFAAAFAVTTRGLASSHGMSVLATLDEAQHQWHACVPTADSPLEASMSDRLRAWIEALTHASNAEQQKAQPPTVAGLSSASRSPASGRHPETGDRLSAQATLSPGPIASDCQIHSPVWVEQPLSIELPAADQNLGALVVVVPSTFSGLPELLEQSSRVAERCLVAIVGKPDRNELASHPVCELLKVDLEDNESIQRLLDRVQAFSANTVVAVDRAIQWDRRRFLASAAESNSLCELLFLIAQREASRLAAGQLELWGMYLQSWNGDVHPGTGAIAGLLKSIHREYPQVRAALLVANDHDMGRAWQSLLDERLQPSKEQEVVREGRRRLVRRLRPVSSVGQASPVVHLDRHSVVIATGGAKGVTAVMVESLLRDHDCTVILIGRSALEAGPADLEDPAVEQEFYRALKQRSPSMTLREMKQQYEAARGRWEAHENMNRLAAAGGRVEYAVADVTQSDQVLAVVEDVVARYGKVDLVLHGAGIQRSKRLVDRTLADFRQTFSTKVAGLHHLVSSIEDLTGAPVCVHALTSAYSIFGNDGQHDYGAANETLDRVCNLNEHEQSGMRWSSIAWLAWDGTGMTRGSEYRALAKSRRLSKIGAELGQQIFREVMSGRTAAAVNVPISAAEHVEYAVRTIPCPVASPHRTLELPAELANIECLADHRIRETPTLPGAWILDLFVNAGRRLVGDASQFTELTIQDVMFKRFVRLANGQEPNVRVVAESTNEGIFVWLLADVLHASGAVLARDVVCATARLQFGSGLARLGDSRLCATGLSSIGRRVSDPYCVGRKDVSLTGRFDCLRDIRIGALGRTARFHASAETDGSIPALLLDAAWRVGAMYAAENRDEVHVPLKIGRIFLPLNADGQSEAMSAIEIRSTVPQPEDRTVRWERTEALDKSGRLRLVVEDACATRLM